MEKLNKFFRCSQSAGYNTATAAATAAAARQFQAQRQRSLNSPGAANVRQNSFTGAETGFPGPGSPSTQSTYGPAGGLFNNTQLRLQRQTSIPQANQHLPGLFYP